MVLVLSGRAREMAMENDSVMMFNKPVKHDITSSGHYCVNIMDGKNKNAHWGDRVLAVPRKQHSDFPGPKVKVPLGKILNPKVPPVCWSAPCFTFSYVEAISENRLNYTPPPINTLIA